MSCKVFFQCLLQVNTNGAISFQVELRQFIPSSFPLGDDRRLLAPFWADVDIRNGGDVWYRESTDKALLERATKDVTYTFVGQQHRFRATWLFITTWHNVSSFEAQNHGLKKVPFQNSFVVFCYLGRLCRCSCHLSVSFAC